MNKISENPKTLFGFPQFFQYWLYTWGGVILNEKRSSELDQMAFECQTTTTVIESYLDVIKTTYSGQSSPLIYSKGNKMFFKQGVVNPPEAGLSPLQNFNF